MSDSRVVGPRRHFLKTTAAGAAAATLASAPHVHAQGNDRLLRVGLIGCGGRGTGAARQALLADSNVKLVALGDAFRDKLDESLGTLRRNNEIADKIDVPAERQFVGLDAYRQVIGAGVDVVLLTSPPGFRPQHIRAAIDADKHVFAEKPVAVDGPGVRAVLAACADARRKRLAVVSGLCYRYDAGKREIYRRIHDGAIGDIVAMHTNYLSGTIWLRPRTPQMTDMEWQVRNWYYFAWLSGDFNVEQHVHSLDKLAWAMRDVYPVRCYGLGGRQVRTGPEFGHIFDHMSVVYEWENGVKGHSNCRQHSGCMNDVNDYIIGTKGRASIMQHAITGENAYTYPRASIRTDVDMYQQEHNEFFASLRRGEPINNGDYMCKSTLMGIMGRMACYSGQAVTFEQALNSQTSLGPANPTFDTPIAVPAVARPGVTRVG